MYNMIYRTYNIVDFPINKCTKLSHLHIDYMRLMGQMPMTDLRVIENFVELEHLGLNTYFKIDMSFDYNLDNWYYIRRVFLLGIIDLVDKTRV